MPVAELPDTLWFLLGSIAFFQLIIFFSLWVVARRLRRVELRQVRRASTSGAADLVIRKAEKKEQKRLFQEFLEEDVSRRDLSKKEQFEAFRKWRNEKGLNWSN